MREILFDMNKSREKTAALWCLDTAEDTSGQRGLFFCSLPLDAIINGRERRDGEPIRSRLACQPKTNCLLALTAGFYLHNSNPKAKAICTLPTPSSGAVFTRRHTEEKRRQKKKKKRKGERSRTEPQWMKPSVKMNQTRSQSHFDPSKHLGDVIVAIHRTVRRISTWLCGGFLTDREGGLSLMIMQMLFNGYRRHLHRVYCPDSRWHNFDRTGGSTTPKRGRFAADSRRNKSGYST